MPRMVSRRAWLSGGGIQFCIEPSHTQARDSLSAAEWDVCPQPRGNTAKIGEYVLYDEVATTIRECLPAALGVWARAEQND